MKTPVTLIIMDGFGLTEEKAGNAILAAGTPNIDQLWESSPHCRLAASGPDVGLPPDTMGNSEVGHTNIGAGRVVYQSLLRISNSIEDGSFFANPVLASAAVQCAATDSAAHIFVLLSDIGVHSDIHHVWALLKLLKDKGVKRAYLHCFMDGRDASPQSGKGYVEEAMRRCASIGLGQVASLCGRFYAMDRDKRWERVQKAYENLVAGTGKACADPLQAMEESYAAGITDEFVEPVICCPEGLIRAGDSIFFMNFRPDRAREITRAFCDPAFDGFPRGPAQCARRLPAGGAEKHPGRIPEPPGHDPAAHRRNGEIRPRHLLLQRRQRSDPARGGPGADPLPQGIPHL